MALTRLALNHSYLTLYVENEQALVFHKIKQSLFHLPPVSVSLLLVLDEGKSEQEAIAQVADISGMASQQLVHYYQDIIPLFDERREDVTYLDGRYPELSHTKLNKTKAPAQSITVELGQASFAINTNNDSLALEITQLFEPCRKTLSEVDFIIDIHHQETAQGEHYNLRCNQLNIDTVPHQDFVMPLIIDHMQVLCFQKSDYLYCFHGAALQHQDGDLLLPGKSGVGKSTLAALLVKQGYCLYSDEMIALDKGFNVKVLPLPMAIKSGSWLHMAELFPEIKQAKCWRRLDGRKLKYLWPPSFSCDENAQEKAGQTKMLVSPNYDAAVEKSLIEPLSIIDSLSLLSDGGYQLGVELTQDVLEHLIDFLASIRREKVYYGNNTQILPWLSSLWQ
ncbi:hypothetical protein [Thalassotalea ganghwensis]